MKINKRFIFTAASCAGTVATAVLAARGGMKAEQILNSRAEHSLQMRRHSRWFPDLEQPDERDEKDEIRQNMSFWYKTTTTAKCYILPVITGAATIALQVAAHREGTALITAGAVALAGLEKKYGAVSSQFKQYMSATKEVVGNEKAQEIITRAATPRDIASLDYNEPKHFVLYWLGEKHLLEFDCSLGQVIDGVVTLNRQLLDPNYGDGWCNVSDFLEEVDAEHLICDDTDFAGWCIDEMGTYNDTYWIEPYIVKRTDGTFVIDLNFYPECDIYEQVQESRRTLNRKEILE